MTRGSDESQPVDVDQGPADPDRSASEESDLAEVSPQEPLTAVESDEALGLPPLVEEPVDVATRVLDEMAARAGERLEAALAAGRLWSEYGPELMRAWDEYREALGPRADAVVFRATLRARWNVDLGPGSLPDSAREANS